MQIDIVWLVLGVICAVIAAGSGIATLVVFLVPEFDERKMHLERWVLSVTFVLTSSAAYVVYHYLYAANPGLLVAFFVWYAIGLLSRLLWLIWRHDLLSPYFANTYDEIFPMFFYAVAGPVVTGCMLYDIIKHKGNPLDWLDKL
jgi:hypothetical protein